jgi:coenzyme F420-reducing hydrogenase beta subunit
MSKYWWSKKWGKDKVCGITHTRLRPGKSIDDVSYTITLNCNHTFYRKPLEKWLTKKNTCPTCRTFIYQS